jgi:hypothetical protein
MDVSSLATYRSQPPTFRFAHAITLLLHVFALVAIVRGVVLGFVDPSLLLVGAAVLLSLVGAIRLVRWGFWLVYVFLFFVLLVSFAIAMPDREMLVEPLLQRLLGRPPALTEWYIWVFVCVLPSLLLLHFHGKYERAFRPSWW